MARRTTVGGAVLALSALAAGCATSGSAATPGAGSTASAADASSCSLANLAKLSPAKQQSTILAGAKKEGSVEIYSASSDEDTAFSKGFEQEYPGIKINFLTLDTNTLLTRVQTEESGGKHIADLVAVTSYDIAQLHQNGLLQENPGKIGILPGYDPRYYGSYWGAFEIIPTVVTWNTNKVTAAEAPTTYSDLLNPKWKGQVSFDAQANQFISGILTSWGYAKTQTFLTNLIDNNQAQIRQGHTLQGQLLSSGAFSISTELFTYNVHSLIAGGAPLAYKAMDPTPATMSDAAVLTNAPHPCAADLAFEYIMSKSGAEAVASLGRIPTNSDVALKYPADKSILTSKDLALVSPVNASGQNSSQTSALEKIAADKLK